MSGLRRYFFILFLLQAVGFMFLTAGCGRKADPVYVPFYEEKEVAGESGSADEKEDEIPQNKVKDAVPEAAEPVPDKPDAPTGLTAVFTGTSILLTWNEVLEQGQGFYRIYRASESGFEIIGTSSTPAYVDRKIEMGMEYDYKVSAVGKAEGPESAEIQIVTEGR